MRNYDSIEIERDGPVATLRLNRPSKMNPLDWGTVTDLLSAIAEIESQPAIQIVVITGNGKAFSAGGDLEKYIRLYAEPAEFNRFLRDFYKLLELIERSPRIFIAAVNGVCVAGGLELILACDVVIVAEEARIADGHLNFGQLPGAGGSQRLPRAIGALRAKELILTGRFISAGEARAIGLASACAPQGRLAETVADFVRDLLTKSQAGRSGAKYLINEGMKGSLADGLELEMAYVHNYATSHADAVEGLMAFREGRSPRFQAPDDSR